MLNISLEKGHIRALDGIRGAAILLVLFFHCSRIQFIPLKAISAFGWTGVDLFFVLSGFLITGILLDHKGANNYFKNFFAKRTLRIFPIYYVSLAAFLGISYFVEFSTKTYYLNHQFYFWTYTQNLLFAFSGWPEGRGYINHFWSLAIEEQFYLFWPLLVGFCNRKTLLWITVGLILLAPTLRNLYPVEPFYYIFTLARIDTLCFGALAAQLIRYHPQLLNKWVIPVSVIAASGLLTIVGFTQDASVNNAYTFRFGYTLYAAFYTCMLLICFDRNVLGQWTNRFFSNQILRFFGKYSYSLYIFHWIVYLTFYNQLSHYFSMFGNYFFFPFVGLLCLLSMVSYYLIEIHFLKLKRYFD